MADLTVSSAVDTFLASASQATMRTNLGVTSISTVTAGTGVEAALAIAVGSAGAVVVFDGALGTPSAGTLTNATGLPISTGLTGAGTNVLTALGNATNAASGLVQLDSLSRITAAADILVDTGGTHQLANSTDPFKSLDLGQTHAAASGQPYAINIENTYNQSGTAASNDLLITRNETALGSGTHEFLNFNVAGVDKFVVDNTGTIESSKGTADEGFINFKATADADATSAISTLTTSGATTHHIQIEINGVTAWIAASTTDPT